MYCIKSHIHFQVSPSTSEIFTKNLKIRRFYPGLPYHLISHFLLYLQNYKEFEAEILKLQSEKYGLSFDIKKYTTSG